MSESPQRPNRRDIVKGALLGGGVLGAVGWSAYRAGKPQGPPAEPFDYNLEAYRQIDPALFVCQEASPVIELALSEPRRLNVWEDRFYVTGDRALIVLSKTGEQQAVISFSEPPYCADVAADGTVFVGFAGSIGHYLLSGEALDAWKIPSQKARLTALAVTDENVFAADAGSRLIYVFDRQGKAVHSIGQKDLSHDYQGFVIPSPYFDLAMAADGLLRVANTGKHRIEAYTIAGDLEFSWGKSSMGIEGFCGCCNPISIALLPDGRFVTCEKGLTRIKIYSAVGDFQGVVAGPEQFTEHDRICGEYGGGCTQGGLDVAVDQDAIYVLDPYTRQIRSFQFNEKA